MPDGTRPTLGILLVDDHVVVRMGLRLLIEKQAGMMVVGEAGSKAEAIAIATREQPEIVILDLCLKEESGMDLIPELLAVVEDTKIIILTGVGDPEEHKRAVRLGAMGVVSKEATAQQLIKAIDRVYAGELWLDRHSTANLVARMRHDLKTPKPAVELDITSQLSSRAREIIALVAEGLKNKEIAGRLYISEATVRHHLTSILKKLDVCDRLELLIFAYRNNLVAIKSDNNGKSLTILIDFSLRREQPDEPISIGPAGTCGLQGAAP